MQKKSRDCAAAIEAKYRRGTKKNTCGQESRRRAEDTYKASFCRNQTLNAPRSQSTKNTEIGTSNALCGCSQCRILMQYLPVAQAIAWATFKYTVLGFFVDLDLSTVSLQGTFG